MTHRSLALALAVLLAAPGPSARAALQETRAAAGVESKTFVRLDDSARLNSDEGRLSYDVVASPDGRHVAYSSEVDGRLVVNLDGKAGEPFDRFGPGGFGFDADGSTLGYTCFDGEACYAVVGGKRFGPFERIRNPGVVFSIAGSHHAFLAIQGDKQHVVIDGVTGPAFDTIAPSTLTFSLDGAHVAYQGRRGTDSFVVVDGKEYGPFGELTPAGVVLSPKGGRFAFGARDGNAWTFVLDGKAQKVDGIVDVIRFDEDGSRIAYREVIDKRVVRVVVDGKASPTYHMVMPANPVFCPKGERCAYVAVRDGSQFLVVEGEEGPGYKRSKKSQPIFSDDGAHYAYVGKKESGGTVVLDGKELGDFASIARRSLEFASDGALFFVARRPEGFVSVFRGKESEPVPGIVNDSTALGPKGQRWAYGVQLAEGEFTVLLDGKAGATHGSMQPRSTTFSPDGQHLAYIAIEDGRPSVVLHGGAASETYDQVLSRPTFEGDHLRFLARRGKDVLEVRMPLGG